MYLSNLQYIRFNNLVGIFRLIIFCKEKMTEVNVAELTRYKSDIDLSTVSLAYSQHG
jgi:hypothetical protein